MINLSCVRERFKRSHPALDADEAEKAYRIFLGSVSAGQIAPREDADLFWHLHVLDTKKYAQDCHMLFGRFLHHVPSGQYCFGDME